MIDLSIIIVSLNCRDYLERCLNSVISCVGKINYEILIVDNGSTDGTVELIRKDFPLVKFIRSSYNRGFGGANNLAMQKARGRYLLLLNPDTQMVQKNTLTGMIDFLDKNQEIGVASCKLLNADRSVQGTGGYFPSLFKVFAWMFFLDDLPLLDRLIRPFHPMHAGSFYKGGAYFQRKHQQDWLTGAFMLIRDKVVKDVGVFDEDYFMYVEEVDFCFRVRKAGWLIWYLPDWQIIHFGQVVSGNEFATLNEFKGVKIFFQKHKPTWQMPILTLLLRMGIILRVILFSFFRGSKIAKTYVKAYQNL